MLVITKTCIFSSLQRLLAEYPSGVISVVSDSYDVYKLVGESFGIKFKE